MLTFQVERLMPRISSCPACKKNLLHLWCMLSCSSNQASFMRVKEVQAVPGLDQQAAQLAEAWVSQAFMERLHKSCKVYGRKKVWQGCPTLFGDMGSHCRLRW